MPLKDALATVCKRQFCLDNFNPREVSFKFHKEVLSTSTTPLLAPWNGFSGYKISIKSFKLSKTQNRIKMAPNQFIERDH